MLRRGGRWVDILETLGSEGICRKVTCEQRPEEIRD